MKLLLSLLLFLTVAIAGVYFTGIDETRKSSHSDMMQLGDFAYQEKRYEDAFDGYKNAAEQGLSSGQLRLSQLYMQGVGVKKDEQLSIFWLEKAAKQGLAEAEYEYATALEFGRGIAREEMEVVAPWYNKAAIHGHHDAVMKIVNIYLMGSGLEKDLHRALAWVLIAEERNIPEAQSLRQQIVNTITVQANNNDIQAQHMLAKMYLDGRGVPQNTVESLAWFRKAAQKGNIESQFYLGKTLTQSESWADALYWLNKAAQQNHTQAGYSLAALLYKTNLNHIPYQNAWRWLYHGSQMHDPKVLYNLATLLYTGQIGLPQTDFNYETWLAEASKSGITSAQNDYGVYLQLHEANAKKSIAWLRRAAQTDVKSQFNLGLIFARGEGITPNDDEAIRWWEQAEKNGSVRAKMMLGLFYNLGRGVGRSEKEAVSWYEKAAKLGDQDAIYNLALLYLQGKGIDRNDEKAAKYFSLLANQGDTEAQNTYASLFLEGIGVPYSPKQAVFWFEKAASSNAKAMFNLATLYRSGTGVSQNDQQALAWYTKAAELNFAPAQNAVGYMYAEGRGTSVDKYTAEIWFQKASDNGLSIALKNNDALQYRGSFSLIRIQTSNDIRSEVLTSKTINLSQWLETHQEPSL